MIRVLAAGLALLFASPVRAGEGETASTRPPEAGPDSAAVRSAESTCWELLETFDRWRSEDPAGPPSSIDESILIEVEVLAAVAEEMLAAADYEIAATLLGEALAMLEVDATD